MQILEQIKKVVAELSPEDLAEFRVWFEEFDAELWDRQFETDVRSHALLERMADEALAEHRAGRTVDLDPEKL